MIWMMRMMMQMQMMNVRREIKANVDVYFSFVKDCFVVSLPIVLFTPGEKRGGVEIVLGCLEILTYLILQYRA
jgi:hypothetical protein